MKHAHHQNYDGGTTDLCEQILLTIWPKLGDFHADIALVGGLAPRYLCAPAAASDPLSAQTLDLDLGIRIAAADNGMYAPLSWRLREEGFALAAEGNRFVKECDGVPVNIDFLVESNGVSSGSVRMVSDIPTNAFPGVERAVHVARNHVIKGRDLLGAEVCETVRVCEAGPYLCLKLTSYAQRAAAKDVFDVMRIVRSYDKGLDAVVDAFRSEEPHNPAYAAAAEVIRNQFQNERGRAAVHYADFCHGALKGQMPSAELNRLLDQAARDVVAAGKRLIG